MLAHGTVSALHQHPGGLNPCNAAVCHNFTHHSNILRRYSSSGVQSACIWGPTQQSMLPSPATLAASRAVAAQAAAAAPRQDTSDAVVPEGAALSAASAAVQQPPVVLTPLPTSNNSSMYTSQASGQWDHSICQQGSIYASQQNSCRHSSNGNGRHRKRSGSSSTKAYGRRGSTGSTNGRRRHQQHQQQHRSKGAPRSLNALQLTARISSQNSVQGVLRNLQAHAYPGGHNLIHLATAFRTLVRLQQQQQQRRQQQWRRAEHPQQQHQGYEAIDSLIKQQQQWRQQQQQHMHWQTNDLSDEDCSVQLLQLLEELVLLQLPRATVSSTAALDTEATVAEAQAVTAGTAAAATATATAATMAGAATAEVATASWARTVAAKARQQPSSSHNARAVATIVYSWGKLQHRPSMDVLHALLEAFLQPLELPAHPHSPLVATRLVQRHSTSNAEDGDIATLSKHTDMPACVAQADQGSCQALANLCWGLSRLGYTCKTPYSSIVSNIVSYSKSRDSLQQSRLQVSSTDSTGSNTTLQLQQQHAYWSRLAAVAIFQVSAASVRDLSSLCYGFASGGWSDVVLWGRLASRITPAMDDFTPHDLSVVLWGYATAGIPHKGLFAAALPAAQQLLPGFSPQGLVNVLWAYITVRGHVPQDLLDTTATECLSRSSLTSFGPLNLSLLVWVYSRSHSISPLLASATAQAAKQVLHAFSPADLCRLLSGLSELNAADIELLDSAELRLLNWLEQGSSNIQIACQGVWAYAAANASGAQRLIEPLLSRASQHLGMLVRSGDATSRLLGTLVLMRYRADGFIALLAEKLLNSAEAQGTAADVAEAVGMAVTEAEGHTPHQLSAAIAPLLEAGVTAAAAADPATLPGAGRVIDHTSRWNVKHVVHTAASLARLGCHQHKRLLQLLVQQFLARQQDILAGRHPFVSSSSGSAAGASKQIVQQTILLLWSAAVLDMSAPAELQQVQQLLNVLHWGVTGGQRRQQPQQPVVLSETSQAKLVQAYMWLQTLGPSGNPLLKRLPQPLLSESIYFWQQSLVPAVVRSPFQGEVMVELHSMKLQAVPEAVTPDGMFSIDILVTLRNQPVAVEVMGPEHYTANKVQLGTEMHSSKQHQQQGNHVQRTVAEQAFTGRTQQQQQQEEQLTSAEPQHVLLGPEQLRLRLLAARGYALMTVSSYEWEPIRSKSKTVKQQLLLRKLEAAVELRQQLIRPAVNGQVQSLMQQRQKREKQYPAGCELQAGYGSTREGQPEAAVGLQNQQQQQPALLQQHVAHVMQQQGPSKAYQRGLLRREQYRQKRRDMHKQAVQMLVMAAPWSGRNSSSNKAKQKHGNVSSISDGARDTTAAEILSGIALQDAVQDRHDYNLMTNEFDIDLDLDVLLLETGSNSLHGS